MLQLPPSEGPLCPSDSRSPSHRERRRRAEHTHLPEPSVNVLSGLEFPGQATGTGWLGYPPFGGWGLTRVDVG